jgi:hypothetical protein
VVHIDASDLNSLTINGDGKTNVITNLTDGVTISALTLTGGYAAYDGGGIDNSGTLTVTNSTISGNSADGNFSDGGGIFNTGTLTVTNSTISANSADDGGGIFNGYYGTLTVTHSTISANTADGYGGGIDNSGTLTVTNSTISDNSADWGGGIYNGYYGTFTAHNTIVAGNTAEHSTDVRWAVTDTSSYNLIGDGSGMSGIAHGENGNLVGTAASPIDPRLGPLGDYGGPTWTMPLLGDSPAIDAGDPDPADPPPTDQRGFGRFVDGDADGNARIDMGAFEYVPDGSVVLGRHVFYNNSFWDTPTAENPEFDDDTAIATDKRALLPGQTAKFANYTSFSRGINGVMVDIANPAGTITNADFEFKVGNDNDPANWNPLLVTPTVDVRPGKGLGDSDRVTLIWPDNTIQNTWLQVTVLGANTGLDVDNVFYFGNAIGEVGDEPTTSAAVDAFDILYARNNPHPFFDPAEITSNYDFDRDQRVDATDILIARNNQTTFFNELNLIDLSGGKALPPGSAPRLDTGEKPAVVDSAPVHDAILRRNLGRESGGQGVSPMKMDWLYEFEQPNTKQRPAKEDESIKETVDWLLTTSWS